MTISPVSLLLTSILWSGNVGHPLATPWRDFSGYGKRSLSKKEKEYKVPHIFRGLRAEEVSHEHSYLWSTTVHTEGGLQTWRSQVLFLHSLWTSWTLWDAGNSPSVETVSSTLSLQVIRIKEGQIAGNAWYPAHGRHSWWMSTPSPPMAPLLWPAHEFLMHNSESRCQCRQKTSRDGRITIK